MPTVSKYFTQYVVYYITGSSPAVGMAQAAEIDCLADGNVGVGTLYFYSDGGRLPENQLTSNGIYLYFRLSRFADVISMLREEKPLYLFLDTVKKVGYIGTNNEPVGEQEGV